MHRLFSILCFCLLLCLATGCDDGVVVNRYHSISRYGWTQEETLYFELDSLSGVDSCRVDVQLRLGHEYPYQELWLVLASHSLGTDSISDSIYLDTLELRFVDTKGDFEGIGVTKSHYSFPVSSDQFRDRVIEKIGLYHIMLPDTLLGVTDVGLRIEK